MSNAWEITEEDVYVVLKEHGLLEDSLTSKILDKAFEEVSRQSDRVEKAVLFYTDFDEQGKAALSEIENILIERKMISDKKKKF